MYPPNKVEKLLVYCYLFLAMVLLGKVILSPTTLVYDEPFHLEGAHMLVSGSSLHDVLHAPLKSTPGPTFPVLHYLLSPLTHLQPPQVRYVNLLLLFLGMVAVSYCLKLVYDDSSWLISGTMLGIPMTWVTAGMALTEIPAFTMTSFSLLFAVGTMKWGVSQGKCYLGFVLCGVFAALSILARQTYLPILVGFGFVVVWNKHCRYPAILGLIIACVIIAPVFAAWGGLMPRSSAYVGGGIAIEHGFLAIAYLAFIIAIIAPSYYRLGWQYLLATMLVVFLVNLLFIRYEWVAASGIAKGLPESIRSYYPRLIGSGLIALFVGFGGSTLIQFYSRRKNKVFIVAGIITLLLVCTAFGITHLFSSRYVMVACPSIFFFLQPFFVPSAWVMVRVTLGAALGLASLYTYY